MAWRTHVATLRSLNSSAHFERFARLARLAPCLAAVVLAAVALPGCPQNPTVDATADEHTRDDANDATPTDALSDAADSGDAIDDLADADPSDAAVSLTPEQFAQATRLYFQHCAGCHGTLRLGATGPALPADRMRMRGTDRLRVILTNGLLGGMPAWVRSGVLTVADATLLAQFLQLPPPAAPPRPIEEIRASWQLRVPVASRPTRAMTTRNWENFFGVILRDAGQVAIIDGDTYEQVAIVETGYAVHIVRVSTSGRYVYAIGRDGRVTQIDLWPPTPQIVAQVQGCIDARSVEASRFPGYDDRYVIEGCYWPPQYVVYDGQTLEPLNVTPVPMNTFDTMELLQESRVASIVPSRTEPVWLVSLKEAGYVAIVDYSMPGFPITARIGAERFLHDGGWDHTGRYFIVAANARNRMAVNDTQRRELVTTFTTGIGPHPGRGANWLDPDFGWVNATGHMGQARLAVYGADPVASPANAWRVVRNITLPFTGSLFVKTHPASRHVWIDFPLSSDPMGAQNICVFAQATGTIERCWRATDHGRITHFEYNRAGTEVWVSVWDRVGEIIVYRDSDLTEIRRITGAWLVTPTGKFNVYNTAHDIY